MAFRIAARTLLELGAELISSDGIALYELIKNSIDADTNYVDVRIFVTLTHTNYDIAMERILRDSVSDAKNWVIEHLEESAPSDLRVEFEDWISNASTNTALANALSDAYDACNWIEVEDRGHGMSLADLEDVYLTIGTRSRRKEKSYTDTDDLFSEQPTKSERILLGDKGVGRLSTMRLGERLEVETTTKVDKHFNILKIDWELFGHESDQMVEDIEVKPLRGQKKMVRSFQGTKVTIKHLKGDWTQRKFQSVLNEDFTRLVDPFESRKANKLLRLYYNNTRHRVPEIPRKLLDNAHAWGKAQFFRSKMTREIVFRGEVHYPLRGDWNKNFRLVHADLYSLLEGIKRGSSEELPLAALDKLGRFDVEFYWYNRRILTEIMGLGTRRDVQDEVRRWAGGLMVFRDGFRVNPYGGPDDDWLELDKKAFGAKGYKVNRNQIVGRVNISWRNRFLIDQTNREGLVDTVQKEALRRLLQHFLVGEFRQFLEKVDEQLKAEQAEDIETIEANIERTKTEVERKILILTIDNPGEKQALGELRTLVQQLVKYVDEAKEVAELYEDDRAKFVHLAGIGLMVEFILHELGRASSHALSILQEINRQALPKRELVTLSSLADQLKTLKKRVDTLDPLSTSRRQRKEPFDLFELINGLVISHGGEIDRHNIMMGGNFDGRQKWNIRAVKGMVVQIIENLIANSFYWLKVEKKINEKYRPQLSIELDPKEKTIIFSDNGPGIAPEDAENVFQAFFTRKPPGEGKGLGLYISREIAEYHGWELYVLKAPNKKGRYNSFVIELN